MCMDCHVHASGKSCMRHFMVICTILNDSMFSFVTHVHAHVYPRSAISVTTTLRAIRRLGGRGPTSQRCELSTNNHFDIASVSWYSIIITSVSHRYRRGITSTSQGYIGITSGSHRDHTNLTSVSHWYDIGITSIPQRHQIGITSISHQYHSGITSVAHR